MISKKVYRYYADCGKAFWTKRACLNHESSCRCWKNPKFKTCLSCIHKNFKKDDDGEQSWDYNDCKNAEMNLNTMFTPAHKNADHICINCPKWEPKKEQNG